VKTSVLKKGDETLIERVAVAGNAWQRMKGLLGRRSLDPGQALFLAPCGSIHTLFMRFHLDLIFVDREFCVRKMARDVPPGRAVFGGRDVWGVLEMETGWFPTDALKEGDRVTLS
jgi:hypothetical protein